MKGIETRKNGQKCQYLMQFDQESSPVIAVFSTMPKIFGVQSLAKCLRTCYKMRRRMLREYRNKGTELDVQEVSKKALKNDNQSIK